MMPSSAPTLSQLEKPPSERNFAPPMMLKKMNTRMVPPSAPVDDRRVSEEREKPLRAGAS